MEHIETKKDFSAKLSQIMGNSRELIQVFVNILTNAIEAMPDGGTITIQTLSPDNEALKNDKKNDKDDSIFVKISDTGIGIHKEDIPKIFDPGFTNWDTGVGKGLGLAIVYNIVQKHNGGIEVDSKVGEGTAIIINIPIEQT